MKITGRSTRFRDDLRRLFLLYALVPLVAAVLVLIGILGFIPLKNVMHSTADDLYLAQSNCDTQWNRMKDMLISLQNLLDLDEFGRDKVYQTKVKTRVYDFINQGEVRSEFFVLGVDEKLVFSTEKNTSLQESLLSSFHWRMVDNLPQTRGEVLTLVVRAEVGVSEVSHMLVGCRLLGRNEETAGYAFFVLDAQEMGRLLRGASSGVAVTDSFGVVYLQTSDSFFQCFNKLNRKVFDTNGFIMHHGTLHYVRSQWTDCRLFKVYALAECGSIVDTLMLLVYIGAAFFTVLIVVILTSSSRVADQKTRIIEEITQACAKVQQGDLDTELSISSQDEFQIIAGAYNSMLQSIRELIQRSVDLGHETAVSKIKQLESQFNPHFLFNTMENIRFMIRIEPRQADRAMVALSELLRYSLRNSGQIVPLREDLAYIRSYLHILEMRFGDRLGYTCDVPQDLMDFPVPKLIAQPIIENAVNYGMKRSRRLQVEMRAYVRDDAVILQVTDNGPGFDPEALERLKATLAAPQIDRGEHIGMMNVHERIRLMYGDRYGISVTTKANEGTTVLLRFPHTGQSGGEYL